MKASLLSALLLLIISSFLSCSKEEESNSNPNSNPTIVYGILNGEMEHDGLQRTYILYVPESYAGTAAVPLLFNFHGYWGTADEHMQKGDFRAIADTAGFIIVHPQGAKDFGGNTHWNVGGLGAGSTTNDIGFTETLLDQLLLEYNIDQKRVYATGMSNGGFMSYNLACRLSERFTAIASVTGSMTPTMLSACNPQRPIPVLEIHGTRDNVVPYLGSGFTVPVERVMAYWADFNNCTPTPSKSRLPDVDATDGSSLEYIVYEDGELGVKVEHYKVIGGTHTWPGGGYDFFPVNNDINASEIIWKFFSQYDIDGLIE